MYTDEDTLRQFGRLTGVYAALAANYTRAAVRQNAAEHTPVMRPLFLMFEDDPQSFLQASLKTKNVSFFVGNLTLITNNATQKMIKKSLYSARISLFFLFRFPFLSHSLIIYNLICKRQVPESPTPRLSYF